MANVYPSPPPHCTRPSSLDNAGQQQQQRQHEECMQSIHQVSGSLYCKDHFRISTWIRGLAGWRDQTATQNKKSSQYSKIKEIVHYLFWITHPTRQLGVLSKRDIKTINALFFFIQNTALWIAKQDLNDAFPLFSLPLLSKSN